MELENNNKNEINALNERIKLLEDENEDLRFDNNAKENLIVDYENDLKKMRANEISQMEEVKKLEVEFENHTRDNLELIKEKEDKIKCLTSNYENIKSQLNDVLKERSDIEETNNLYRGMLKKKNLIELIKRPRRVYLFYL
jgi:chromosome segregation ATPase